MGLDIAESIIIDQSKLQEAYNRKKKAAQNKVVVGYGLVGVLTIAAALAIRKGIKKLKDPLYFQEPHSEIPEPEKESPLWPKRIGTSWVNENGQIVGPGIISKDGQLGIGTDLKMLSEVYRNEGLEHFEAVYKRGIQIYKDPVLAYDFVKCAVVGNAHFQEIEKERILGHYAKRSVRCN